MLKWLSLIILISLLFSCSENKEADWTILIYMAADNGLNDDALADIDEMMTAQFPDEINVIVQIDESEYSDDPSAKRYKITPGSKKIISNLGEINSGDYNTLTQFANWGFDKYPSARKSLFIWSHGNGWYPRNRDLPPSFCPDEHEESYISVADKELKNALKNINSKIDILVFDACNMQTLEVINEVYKYANFIVGSEDQVDNDGFPYELILSSWNEYENVQYVAESIANNFHYYYWLNEDYPISCSVVKSSIFPVILNDLSTFTSIWADSAYCDVFQTSRSNCLEFNESWINLPADIDIKQFLTEIVLQNPSDSLQSFCEDFIVDLDACFVFQKTDEYPTGYTTDDVGTGIIWFPDNETQYYFDERLDEYLNLDFSETNWQIFLENFLEYGTP